MIEPTTITEQLMFSTVRIEATMSNGAISTGTGFFFEFRDDRGRILLIITNKHVIVGSQRAKFKVHLTKNSGEKNIPSGRSEYVMINDIQKIVILHPDLNDDTCVIQVADLHLKEEM